MAILRRTALLGLVGAACLVNAPDVLAETAAADGGQAAQPGNRSAGPKEIESVVVSTQKRGEEALVDVPMAVSVKTGDFLADISVDSTLDLTFVMPGLNFTTQGSWAQPAIRGVSSEQSVSGNDANVALYIDGVYFPNQVAAVFEFPDVGQVEVLRGPQGTLFGRNVTGGAVMVNSLDPSFETTVKASASYGTYDGRGTDFVFKGYVSSAVTDKVAFGIAGMFQQNDGYFKNIVVPEDATFLSQRYGRLQSTALRGKVLIEPNDNLQILFSGIYVHRKDAQAQTGTPYNGQSLGLGIDPTFTPDRPYEVAVNPDFPSDTATDLRGGSMKVIADLGFATLTSLTAYTYSSFSVVADVDGTAVTIVDFLVDRSYRDTQQEITLASPSSDRFSWVLGLWYFNDDVRSESCVNGTILCLPTAVSDTDEKVTTTSLAAYGEAQYDITDDFSIIGGIRYSWEKKKLFFDPQGRYGSGLTFLGDASWDNVTYRASAIYSVSDVANVYFTYSRGFKSGAFNTGNPNAYDPEKIDSFQAGFKMSDGLINLDLAAFYYDYRNIQRQIFNGFTSVTTNAAAAEIYGVELEWALQITDEFQLTGNVAWLPKADFTDFPNASVFFPNANGSLSPGVIDAEGYRLIRAPKFTANLTGKYTKVFQNGTLDAVLSGFFTSKFNWETLGRVQQPSHVLLNARMTWTFPGDQWAVSLWGRNLANEVSYRSALFSGVADMTTYAPPRAFGISVEFNL